MPKIFDNSRLLCASLLTMLSTSAFAQSVTEDGDYVHTALVVEIVVVANGSAQRPEKVGQAFTLIKREEIEQKQFQTVSDLLATTQGVTVTRNGGIGQTTAVRIRGAEGDQTLTLIDGVRVNDPSSPGGAFDFANLLSGNIERIEILRGPNSVPWGSQALGGVVNIVTAQPDGDFSGSARAEYGFKNSKQFVGQIGGTAGIVTASLGGGYFEDDGISAFSGGTERDGYRQYGANGRIGVEISDDINLDFRGYYANSRVAYDGFQSSFPFGQTDTNEFGKTQELFGYAGLNATLFDGALKNRLSFTISDINRDNFDPAFGTAPSFFGRGRVERIEYQGDARISDNIRSVFGIEHENSGFTDGFSPASTNLNSIYAQLILDPTNRLTISGGARLDDHKNYGTKATFSANAAWRPASGTIIRASFGEGFKAPTLFQLFSDFGNPALKPETARSYDVSIEQSLINGTLKLGATLFARDTNNQIDFASCFGSTAPICATRPDGYYDNIARTRAQGVEAFVEMRPTSDLTLSANYSLIDAKNRATNRVLLRRPKHSVNAAIDWAARDWLKVGASIQTVSDSVDGFGGSRRLDGYTLVALRAAVPIGEALEIYGRIENLFDAGYATVAGFGTLGRNAHIGVRAKF